MRRRQIVAGSAFIALILGLTLPIIRTETLWLFSDGTSIAGSVMLLWTSGAYLLSLLIAVFSIILPLAKWYLAIAGSTSGRDSRWLILAKWSMLDVFIVVGVAGMVQFGVLGTAFIGPALLPFVIGLLGTTWLTMSYADLSNPPTMPKWQAWCAIALLGLLWFAPLMILEKYWVFSASLSLHSAAAALASQKAWITLVIIIASALLVPAYASLSAILGPFPGGSACVRWQMVDVFAVAMAILAIKLVAAGDAAPQWGLAIAFLAGLVYGIPAVRNRSYEPSSEH